MSKIKAVAWDLDGTLANSEALAMPAAVGAAADYVQQQQKGVVVSSERRDAFVQQLMGKTITEIGEGVGHAYGVKMPANLQDLVTKDTIKLLAAKCEPIAGAIDTVREIKAAGLTQWIATSSAAERVQPTLQKTGLSQVFPVQEMDWFSAKITKPDPEVYQRSMQTRGFKPDEVMAVEDSPTGVKAAVAAGIKHIVAFTGGAHIPEARKSAHMQLLIEAGATQAITDLRQLPKIIHVINQEPSLPKARAATVSGAQPTRT
jgi:HAD superfamily hydrolase (TIGR01509 family)